MAKRHSNQSVMKHDFSRVPSANIPRSKFDRSHGCKTTFDAGLLIPIFLDEALPGDTFNLSMTAFARLATPLHPFMDNLFMDTQFFAVPYRLIWDNWEKFMGAQDDPGDSTDFLIPIFTNWDANNFGGLHDYFGLPTGPSMADWNGLSALPFRAYHLIWNEWYRDQNLQDSKIVNKGDGPDNFLDAWQVLRRGKRHDYFTSCLPWPQKGPAVPLPLSGDAPVRGIGQLDQTYPLSTAAVYETGKTGATTYVDYQVTGATTPTVIEEDPANAGFPGIYADLSVVTATTINALRQAFQIQKLYERDARGGTRYTEIVRSHFGVTSPDARLQRPEYLGGGSTPIMVNPVAQTSSSDTQPTPQGNLAAVGTASINGHGFTKSFTEHCLVIGLVSVRADLNYQQGTNRMWRRQTRWDFFWPALQAIGEQAVLNEEIWAEDAAENLNVFGYQERFAEYRYKPSLITGQMRSDFPQSLDTWHLAQDFATLPLLNSAFIEENPPVDRVVAVPSEPDILFDAYFSFLCARPMPMYSVPGMIDHF